jgi:hypothetical protein
MVEFARDDEMRKIEGFAQEFYDNIIEDEQLFCSDEATVWAMWYGESQELIAKISAHYGKTVTEADLKQPLWKLLHQINEGRAAVR